MENADAAKRAKLESRLIECERVLAELAAEDGNAAKEFEIIREWAKIKHAKTGHELMPGDLAQFLKTKTRLEGRQERAASQVADPAELSRFLSVHKRNPKYLYCHLTKKMVTNNLTEAEQHIEGANYRHKLYEWMRRKFKPRRDKIESSMRTTRKLMEYGRIKKLKLGSLDERNVLHKGFLKQRKLMRIKRYSKLIIMSFKRFT